MTTVVAVALVVTALLTPGASGMREGEAVNTKYPDVLQSFRNISQSELEYLRNAVIESAEKITDGFVARFTEVLTVNETERDALLAAGAKAGRLELTGHLSMRDGDEGEDGDEEALVDTIRRIIREGLPSRGIPPLDPLSIDQLPEINLDIPEALVLHVDLSGLKFEGLAAFKEEVDISFRYTVIPPTITVSLTFDVLFPRLHLLTQYTASGYAEAGLDIRGDGDINIDIFRLRLKGDVNVRATLLSARVDPCDINISSNSFKLEIDGLFGDGHLSDLAGEIVTEMINEYVWDLLFDTVSRRVENGVCTQLRSMTTTDWIALILRIIGSQDSEDPPESFLSRNVSGMPSQAKVNSKTPEM